MRRVAVKFAAGFRFWIIPALALILAAIPAGAQKKDKNKNASASEAGGDLKPGMYLPDSQAVDLAIGEALGYWQIGDADSLHKYYSDDVVVVSGAWEPPVIGWDNFLRSYQAQRARVSGMRMDRSNTVIKVTGNTAWATYQFLFTALLDGKTVQYRGHTSLVLMKQADRWVITLNHSSVVDSSQPEPATPMDSTQPSSKR
jgi:ketosteroid isomerase-like protein